MRHLLCIRSAVVLVAALLVAAPGRARAGDGAAELGLVPEGASFVACLNVEKLRKSPFKKKVFRALQKSWPNLATLRDAGFNLEKNVDTILFAGDASAQRPELGQLLVVVSGSVAAEDLRIKLATHAEARLHRGVAYHTKGDVTLAALDGKLIITRTVEDAQRVIDVFTGNGKGLAARSGFKRLYGGVDRSADVWMAAKTDDGAQVAPVALEELTAAAVSLDLKSGAGLRVRLHAKNDDHATALEAKVRAGMKLFSARAEIAPIVERVHIERDKSAIGLTVELTRKEMEAMMRLADD